MPLVNFTKFNLNQLRQISRELNDTIEQRTEEEREKAAAEIKKIANALGMTVEEIMAGKKGKRGRKFKTKKHVPAPVQQPSMPEAEGMELSKK
jgi:hypothetical protein